MSFTPQDPDYAPRVQAGFARQPVMTTLGVTLVGLRPGEVDFEMPWAAAFTQQHGFIHAGIMTTVLDSACGYAAYSLMPADAGVLTIEFKTNLLAPARGERFLVHGRVVKPGRTITVCDAEAFACEGDRRTRVATMTGTLMALFGRPGID